MAKYRTALGKVVDMSTLAAKNEKVRAVGNMKVNARGDTIDATGRVIQPVTSKVSETYSKTVGNRSANVVQKKPQTSAQRPPVPKQQQSTQPPKPVRGGVNARISESELTDIERELESELEDDIEVEQIKAKETKTNGKK